MGPRPAMTVRHTPPDEPEDDPDWELSGGAVELYLRLSEPCEWAGFAQRCLTLLPPARPFDFSPYPRVAPESFCVSLRFEDQRPTALSIFADERALPPDGSIARAWMADMTPGDRDAYDIALGAVRSLGRRPPCGWHAMLAWTVEADGTTHRAASLRVPRLR